MCTPPLARALPGGVGQNSVDEDGEQDEEDPLSRPPLSRKEALALLQLTFTVLVTGVYNDPMR